MSLMRLSAPILLCAALSVGAAGSALGASGSKNPGGLASASSLGDPTIQNEIMVKLRTGDALAPLLAKYPVTMVGRFGARPIFRLRTIGKVRAKDLLAQIALEPDVMIAEANNSHRSPEARKNMPWTIGDPVAYVNQWFPQAIRLSQAQALSRGAGVRVAVLDTGVDTTHPALAGRLLPGFDFVDFDNDASEVGGVAFPSYGHGTHVAGLVAMVAPDAKIVPIRVLDADGVGNAWVLAEALLYAADPDGNPATDDGAQVANLSLGSLSRTRIMATISQIVGCEPEITDDPIGDRSDPGYNDDRARCATGKGMLVVAAAGNDGSNSVKQYPAAESAYGLLPVGATAQDRRVASFSNDGPWIDLAAPGDGITSALPGGSYGTWSGTSMASPLAAGVAALVRSFDPSLTSKDTGRRLSRTGPRLCGGTNMVHLDALAAVSNVIAPALACR